MNSQRLESGSWTANLWRKLCLAGTLAISGLSPADADTPPRVLVLSAASASTVIQDIAAGFSSSTGIDVRISAASSGTLARQISRGAPADIYVSASETWIENLTKSGHLEPEFIRPLMRNRLVVVAPALSSLAPLLDLTKPVTVLTVLDGGRLAIGDPNHVPAGQYAKEAIINLGLWPAVRDRLAPQVNVRAVLALVERGETPLGVIYATDAALSQKVKIAAIVPPDTHAPIQYAAAVITGGDRPESRAFFEALTSSTAHAMIARRGFALPTPAKPDTP